jgi:hypothetical protein
MTCVIAVLIQLRQVSNANDEDIRKLGLIF